MRERGKQWEQESWKKYYVQATSTKTKKGKLFSVVQPML